MKLGKGNEPQLRAPTLSNVEPSSLSLTCPQQSVCLWMVWSHQVTQHTALSHNSAKCNALPPACTQCSLVMRTFHASRTQDRVHMIVIHLNYHYKEWYSSWATVHFNAIEGKSSSAWIKGQTFFRDVEIWTQAVTQHSRKIMHQSNKDISYTLTLLPMEASLLR